MELFRVFDWDGATLGRAAGGPLFVARERQGSGRHDAPLAYGACYCSRHAVSAVAESIQYLRGHLLTDEDFARVSGRRKALARLWLDDAVSLIDLDDPRVLLARRLRPSQAATRLRLITQRIAVALFEEGAAGFSWWSSLEASWTNLTLYSERASAHLSLIDRPAWLSTTLPVVKEAAVELGIST